MSSDDKMENEFLMVNAGALRLILRAYESQGDPQEDAAYDQLESALRSLEIMRRGRGE